MTCPNTIHIVCPKCQECTLVATNCPDIRAGAVEMKKAWVLMTEGGQFVTCPEGTKPRLEIDRLEPSTKVVQIEYRVIE